MKASECKFLYTLVFGVVLAASSPALSATFTVSPSGDRTGVTDQANIKTALEAATDGGTVELAAGTFYLQKSIVVFDFNATFKGAGKALTTVQTAPGIAFDVSASLDAMEGIPPARGVAASMFMFPYSPSDQAKTFKM